MVRENIASVRKLIITMDDSADSRLIEGLSGSLKQAPKGDAKVIVKLHGSMIETPFCIIPAEDTLALLRKLKGVASVE